MIEYPSTPFVYETEVLAVEKIKGETFVRVLLPGAGEKVLSLGKRGNEVAYQCVRASRECFRDIAYHVFGEDWRWYEASMNNRDRKRMMFAIGKKIVDCLRSK